MEMTVAFPRRRPLMDCAAVVRDHHRRAAPEELERCLVPVQPARHFLIQIGLYEEVPAVGERDDEQVQVYPLTSVAVIKMPFVADQSTRASTPGAFLCLQLMSDFAANVVTISLKRESL